MERQCKSSIAPTFSKRGYNKAQHNISKKWELWLFWVMYSHTSVSTFLLWSVPHFSSSRLAWTFLYRYAQTLWMIDGKVLNKYNTNLSNINVLLTAQVTEFLAVILCPLGVLWVGTRVLLVPGTVGVLVNTWSWCCRGNTCKGGVLNKDDTSTFAAKLIYNFTELAEIGSNAGNKYILLSI